MRKNLQTKIVFYLCLLLPVQSFSQILLSEDFSSGSLPAGWTNDSLGLPADHLWIFNNQYNRVITGAGFDANFAIFDSDEGSVDDMVDENVSLTTPSINISAATILFLELDQQYREVIGATGGTRVLEISTDNGANWINLDSSQSNLGYPNPAVHTIYDLTSYLPATSLMVRFHYYGSWDWWWAIDNIEVINYQQCTVAPNAGSAQANMSTVCSADTFVLDLVGEDNIVGLTFQWQSSPDSINWTNMPGDTTEFNYANQLVPTYYRCALTCNAQTSYSSIVYIEMGAAVDCYCIGIFTMGCDVLNKVIFNSLMNVNSGCNGNVNNFILYPDTGLATTTVYADSTYDITIASGTGSGNHGAGVWFDFDHNGDFRGVGEYFHISDSIPENSSDFTVAITIPSNAFSTTRMKVRYVYNNQVTYTSDCATYSYGETEEYLIYILNSTIGIDIVLSENINVYPVPAQDLLRISTGQIQGRKIFRLYDQTGRLCSMTESISNESELNVGRFNRGIYFLRIETPQGSISKKILLN